MKVMEFGLGMPVDKAEAIFAGEKRLDFSKREGVN